MAATFEVVGQREVMDLNAETGAVKSVEVTFRTKPNNILGTVLLPRADYSPDNANRAITAYAEQLEATHSL